MRQRSISAIVAGWLQPRYQFRILVSMLFVVLIGSQLLKATGHRPRNDSTLDLVFMKAVAALKELSPIDHIVVSISIAIGSRLLLRHALGQR